MNDVHSLAAALAQLPAHIMAGETQPLLDIFADGNISVNVPRYGQIGNNIVFSRYLNRVREWISQRSGARFEYWGEVHNDRRMAANMVLYFDIDDTEFRFHQTLHIPISVMCELSGSEVSTARVYYSTLWIAGHNIVRPAMLNEDPSIIPNLPQRERLYFQSLWAGDSQTILREVLSPDAYFMGTSYSYNAGTDLFKTFDHLFENGHNTELRLCSAFHDESHLVVEYMNHRSGGNPNTPSAGMAIYGLRPDGRFAYVRLAGDSLFDHCLWPTL